MVFSSIVFLCIFFPAVILLYYLCPRQLRNLFLLLASLFFYAWGEPKYIVIMLFSTIFDYCNGRLLEYFEAKGKKDTFGRLVLAASVIGNLSILCFFKYTDFILTTLNSLSGSEFALLGLALPIGISFYTFQTMSYTIDVYRGQVAAQHNLISFGMYVCLFPQLIAGPIVRYSDIAGEVDTRETSFRLCAAGMHRFLLGLGKKVLLANQIGALWDEIYSLGASDLSMSLAWLGALSFTFQIYFDFSGYSDMAFGLGEMFGFHFPENFCYPYTAKSITEFWRRWHMTLGSWFREYLYIPLGGNRKGRPRQIANLFVVWFFTGLWHGAGWNFILWGLVTFLLIVSEKYLFGKAFHRYPIIGRLYMIVAIPVTWALFAVEDINQLCIFFSRLFPFIAESPFSVFRYDYLKYLEMYYPFLIAGLVFSTKLPYNILKRIKNKVIISIILCVIFAGSIYCIYKGYNDPFLYFRF